MTSESLRFASESSLFAAFTRASHIFTLRITWWEYIAALPLSRVPQLPRQQELYKATTRIKQHSFAFPLPRVEIVCQCNDFMSSSLS